MSLTPNMMHRIAALQELRDDLRDEVSRLKVDNERLFRELGEAREENNGMREHLANTLNYVGEHRRAADRYRRALERIAKDDLFRASVVAVAREALSHEKGETAAPAGALETARARLTAGAALVRKLRATDSNEARVKLILELSAWVEGLGEEGGGG